MKIEKEFLHISQNTIDITDPCYDSDTWCRMNNMPIEKGEYQALIRTNDFGRILSITLIPEDMHEDDANIQEVDKGYIGVDAGLAGFFENKPDYPDDEWYEVCSHIKGQDFGLAETDSPFKCNGVWCSSGWGDGEYPVTQLRYKATVIGYRIDFMED